MNEEQKKAIEEVIEYYREGMSGREKRAFILGRFADWIREMSIFSGAPMHTRQLFGTMERIAMDGEPYDLEVIIRFLESLLEKEKKQ